MLTGSKRAFKEGKITRFLMQTIGELLNHNYADDTHAARVSPDKEFFDKWHTTTLDKMLDMAAKYKISSNDKGVTNIDLFSKEGFALGHAQKWLNMTLKYMLLMGLWKNSLDPFVPHFHVPLDTVVLREAHDQPGIKNLINNQYKLKVASNYYAWSKIPGSQDGFQAYAGLQKAIANSVDSSPIEWEMIAWNSFMTKLHHEAKEGQS